MYTRFRYRGRISSHGKDLGIFKAETMARSYKEAENNIKYQAKRACKINVSAAIELANTIEKL